MRALFLVLLLLVSCQSKSLVEYKKKGVALQLQLLEELRPIQNVQDLERKKGKLAKIHLEIVHVIKQAKALRDKGEPLSLEDAYDVSFALRDEILRICGLPGARKVLEEIQAESLYQIDHLD